MRTVDGLIGRFRKSTTRGPTRVAVLTVCASTLASPGLAQVVVQPYRLMQPATGAVQLVVDTGLLPGGLSTNPLVVPPSQGLRIEFTCDTGVDCTTVTVVSDHAVGRSFVDTTAQAGSATVTIPANAIRDEANTVITVRVGNVAATPALTVSPSQVPQAGDRTLMDILALPCSSDLTRAPRHYFADHDSARFVVTPIANVLARPARRIDENDKVIVHVVGAQSLLRNLRVRRSSDFRPVGQVSVLGGTVDLAEALDLQSAAPPECGLLRVELGDFASGRGEVELEFATGETTRPLGQFDFGVNPLYSGAFSFGPVVTELEAREFGLLPDSTITLVEASDTRADYFVAYTHFIWGRRDIESDRGEWFEHLNPTIGLLLNDPLDNVLVGASVDLLDASVYVSYGIHGAQVRELDPASGLSINARFLDDEAEIPVRRRWSWKPFWALSVDLRVAVQLLGQVFGS